MINYIKNIFLSAALALFLATGYAQSTDEIYGGAKLLNQEDEGFRGIWYMISAPDSEYKLKYGGGLGTYPANHYPFSVREKSKSKLYFSDIDGNVYQLPEKMEDELGLPLLIETSDR